MKKNFLALCICFSIGASAQTYNGKVGINTTTPTEILHVNGTERVSSLPLHTAVNSIYTKPDGTVSAAKDQTFTATRTVVADNNGVLGYVSGVATTNNLVITTATSYTIPGSGTYIATAYPGASTFTMPTTASHGDTVTVCAENVAGQTVVVNIVAPTGTKIVIPSNGAIATTTVDNNNMNGCRVFRYDAATKYWWSSGL